MTRENTSSERPAPAKVALGSPGGFLAFGLGAGLAPWAPGTAGTLLALPVAVALRSLAPAWFWLALTVLFIAGIGLCGRASRRIGLHDHGGIVWDEMVGFWLAAALVPLDWRWLLAAFLLFRVFDIFKPWPIRQLDRRVGGGFGIMLDDVIAGFYTLVLLAGLEALVAS